MRVGILAGTGFTAIKNASDAPLERVRIETPFGAREPMVSQTGDHLVFFLNRHGDGHATPAHRIDHRANLEAFRRARVDLVLSLLNTGALRPGIPPGTLVIPHDFVALGAPALSLHDNAAIHVELSDPYCPHAREALLAAAERWDPAVHARGVYVQTSGPRLETPAEVAHLAQQGDIVGMTGASEAVMAREAGLCHGALAFVANPAAGVGGRVDAAMIRDALTARAEALGRILLDAAARFPATRSCACREATRRGRIAPPGVD